jgi:general secretion pathway protein H
MIHDVARPIARRRTTARRPGRARGFTLMEIGVAIFLLALFLGIVVPGFGALSGAQLKKTTGMIGGLVRDTYARAALSGRSYRVVFDLEEGSYWVEESEGIARMKRARQELERDGKALLDKLDERVEDAADGTTDEDREKVRLLTGPGFKPVEGEDGKHTKLPDDVRFKSIWVEHLEKEAAGGQVAMHFFPGGYAEEAHITLTDDDEGDRTMTVVVNPLTGEVEVVDEEPRIPSPEGP